MSLRLRGWLALIAAALVIQLALASPTIELPVILLALVLGGSPMRVLVVLALTLLTAQKMADLVMQAVLARPFDIAADLPLIDAAVRLSAGSFGRWAAGGAVLATLLACAAVIAALWWAAGQWTARAPRDRIAVLAALTLILLPFASVTAPNARYALARIDTAGQTLAALRVFRAATEHDPMRDRPGLLGAIDRDVLVIFVESYGRSSFDVPFYAQKHLATLRKAQGRLTQAGMATRSGFLTSPTQGGQSWLAHATLADGLWVGNQTQYRAVLSSGRRGLFHYAQRAGFRTAAVMPAITRPWPEAASMGFDRVLAAADLGYRGPAFNWVTMPDQFTLSAADRILGRGGRQPLFAQIVLISSHAPWVPVPRLIAWDAVGDGVAFADMAQTAQTPEQVWRDPENVRRHYRDALDYALQTVMDYALRRADDPPLILIAGDHPAAQDIAQSDRREVPMHLVGPKDLVDRSAAWGFAPGLVPPPGQPAIAMDRMRDLILLGFARSP